MASLTEEDGMSIVDLLECPVCLRTMKPPMYQCLNGHSVCGECKSRKMGCPTCRGKIIDTRNRIVEELAYKVRYPCINKVRGCYENTHLKDMEKHESVCPHRMYHCLVDKDNGCTWTGKRSDILPHTEEKHNEFIYRWDCNLIVDEGFNFNEQWKFSNIILFRGEIFWYRSELDPLKRMLYEAVQYIGPEENASKYAYKHTLVSPSGDKKWTFQNVVKCETDELENMRDLRECFVMDYDTLKMFAQDGKAFKFTVEMCKEE
jgi:E3 ubiquitin-protein ligase SIAH1